ncbi:Flagellar biosynthesis protein FlhB [Chitinispirillum alkaliphilum]|nr:Flagellar biosynthesis protein FlhB [Chitinispirillum alkaliphilum]
MKRNKRDTAVAVSYNDNESTAPKVVAKGHGETARKILQTAQEHKIPVRQDNDLVELLAQIDIDREIPPELYAAVAEILSWVYKANNEALVKD